MSQLIFTDAGVFPMHGRWIKEVWRTMPNGSVVMTEREERDNLIVSNGMDYLASRVGSRAVGTNSPMYYTAIGTVTTAATLTNATLTGEVKRKAYDVVSLNGNVWTVITTWGGSADSVASVSIVEAGTFNHASSAQGIMFQRVTFSSVVLANSDFLSLQIDTTVGSR
jgi:hypothetical protein